MLQEHYLNVHCSRSIFRHAPGAFCILHMLLEHICYMLLEHCAFKYAPVWSIFDLEYYPRIFMLREQLFLEQLLLEHNFGPKSHRSLQRMEWKKNVWCTMHAKRLLDTPIIRWNNWKRGYMEKLKYSQNYIVPGVLIFRNDCSKIR